MFNPQFSFQAAYLIKKKMKGVWFLAFTVDGEYFGNSGEYQTSSLYLGDPTICLYSTFKGKALILCEIDFDNLEAPKTNYFDHLRSSKFRNCVNL